ncbi:hypothetical protein FRB96_001695 [Tulasnella sp. 330]|nr:hypothetical protein FRB96_001695 [Tulasnella sp. 330]KAG8882121.1 hypothetical protein FRB97_008687 [Tulasnella sp. 331]
MNNSSLLSWEAGTRAETILEVDFPELSVFSSEYLSFASPYTPEALTSVISIAQTAVSNRTSDSTQLWGASSSAGDPTSLGVVVLLANRTHSSDDSTQYAQAAQEQLELILTGTPRIENGLAAGAISHRTDSVALWSDFMYMTPPFLAYYGAITNNVTLILEAYNQISLYRSALFSPSASLWQHIYCPGAYSAAYNNFNDSGHWATGNGWAAAGMLRVLATMKNSPQASQFHSQQNDLSEWITEIHAGMANVLPASGVFNNYVDIANGTRVPSIEHAWNFPDASGTALFAGTVYRHVTLSNPANYTKIVEAAETARNALYAKNGSTHFDGEGWLMPVVDPHVFAQAGNHSDEAQSFVLQLENSWQAWLGASAGTSLASGGVDNANTGVGSDIGTNSSGGGRQGGLVIATPTAVVVVLGALVMLST